MFKRLALMAFVLFFSSFAYAGVTLKHHLGEITLGTYPKRIIALDYSFVDALASLDVVPIGIADDKNPERIIPQIRSKIDGYTSVGSRYQPSIETISNLKPDFIIADVKRHQVIFDQLSNIAPTILLDSSGGSYHEILDIMAVIAKALGKDALMAKKLKEHKEKMADFIKMFNNHNGQSAVFMISSAKGTWLHTKDSYAATMLQELGFKSPITKKSKAKIWLDTYANISLEQLLSINPDIVIVGEYGDNTLFRKWQKNPLWNSISAAKKEQIYKVDGNLWSRSRGMTSAEIMASQLAKMHVKN